MKKSKLFISSMVTTIAAVGAVSVAGATAVNFSDVKEGDSHYVAIMELAQRGIIQGYGDGTFKPNQPVTRGQAAKMLVGFLQLNPNNHAGFHDIPQTHPYAGAIGALKEAGIIDGYEDGTFRPNEPITRNHIAKMMVRALHLPTSDTISLPFTDVAQDYQQDIAVLMAHRITIGTSATTFSGEQFVTRGQLASFIVRAEQAIKQLTSAQQETVTFMEAALTIEGIHQGKLTAAGQEWAISKRVQTLLNDKNAHALTGARIHAIMIDGEIVDILTVALNASGQQGANIVFDGGNSTFAGNLLVHADFVELKNITVTQDVVVTPRAATSFSMTGLKAENLTIIYGQQPIVTASLTKVKLANTADQFTIFSAASSATSLSVLPATQQGLTFWEEEKLTGLSILNQQNEFQAGAQINREELAKIIVQVGGRKGADVAAPSFRDMPTGAWYSGILDAARKSDLISDSGNDLFAPSEQITKEELATIVASALGRQQGETGLIYFAGNFTAQFADFRALNTNIRVSPDVTFVQVSVPNPDLLAYIGRELVDRPIVSDTTSDSGSQGDDIVAERQRLQQAIAQARSELVAISVDGRDVLAHQQWTTQEARNQFQQAIDAASSVSTNATTVAAMLMAQGQLQQARSNYNNMKLKGTLIVQTAALQESLRVAKLKVTELEQQRQDGTMAISIDGKNVPQAQKWLPQHMMEALQAQIQTAEALLKEISASNVKTTQQTINQMVDRLHALVDITLLDGLQEIIAAQNALTGQQIVTSSLEIDPVYQEVKKLLSQELQITQDHLLIQGNQVTVTLHEAIHYLNPTTLEMEEWIPAITVQLPIVQAVTITGATRLPNDLLLTTADSVQLAIGTELIFTVNDGQTIVGTVAENTGNKGILIRFNGDGILPGHTITRIEANDYHFIFENASLLVTAP